MLTYKRNQMEEAVSQCLTGGPPTSELKTRVKRLLELDREAGRNRRSTDPEIANYAFFSDESPGRGTEVSFSGYEAFALMTGLRLQQHKWPQSFPITVLRRIRADLEPEHSRILRQDPTGLFDPKAISAKAAEGALYVDNTDPVFLAIVSDRRDKKSDEMAFAVCRGTEAVGKFLRQQEARAWTLSELTTAAHRLAEELAKAEPRHRGRS